MKYNVTIRVYMQDGTVYQYSVSPTKAREHAHRIITTGYRQVIDGEMTYFPVNQILKVVFPMPLRDYLADKYEEQEAK